MSVKLGIMTHYDKLLEGDKLKGVINQLIVCIEESKIAFDCVAVRGVSMAILAGPLSIHFKKEIILVCRSEHRNANIGSTGSKYIIVDDLICTGKTIEAVVAELADRTCVGIFLHYEEHGDYWYLEAGKIPCFYSGGSYE